MSILELFAGGSGLLFLVLSMIEIAPIKVNPWSAIARALGSVINRDVIARLDDISRVQRDTQRRLDDHIKLDDERDADMHRAKILRFNNELLRDIPPCSNGTRKRKKDTHSHSSSTRHYYSPLILM